MRSPPPPAYQWCSDFIRALLRAKDVKSDVIDAVIENFNHYADRASRYNVFGLSEQLAMVDLFKKAIDGEKNPSALTQKKIREHYLGAMIIAFKNVPDIQFNNDGLAQILFGKQNPDEPPRFHEVNFLEKDFLEHIDYNIQPTSQPERYYQEISPFLTKKMRTQVQNFIDADPDLQKIYKTAKKNAVKESESTSELSSSEDSPKIRVRR